MCSVLFMPSYDHMREGPNKIWILMLWYDTFNIWGCDILIIPKVIVMVGVFCFCWTPYATISMAAILGHGKVVIIIIIIIITNIIMIIIIDYLPEHPTANDSASTTVCKVCDCLEPCDLPRHEPNGGYHCHHNCITSCGYHCNHCHCQCNCH